MSTTCEGSGAAGKEATHALRHHDGPQSLGHTAFPDLPTARDLHTETHEKTRQSNKTHNKIKTTKHMVGEYTSITLLLTDIHLSTSNAILFRKLHYWQDMTEGFTAPDRCPSSQTTFNCRTKVDWSNHNTIKCSSWVCFSKGADQCRLGKGWIFSTQNHYLDRISTPSGGANWLR